MSKVIFKKEFRFSPNGYDIKTYLPSQDVVEVTRRCAEVAVENGFASPVDGEFVNIVVEEELSTEELIDTLNENDVSHETVEPHLLSGNRGWYDVIGVDGQPINKSGKLRKKHAEKMLTEYVNGLS